MGSSFICYSVASFPLSLRPIKPCGLRDFYHKQISPCELRLAWLACASSIRCLSHMTGVVFAFLNVRRTWTLSRLLNREMHYQLCYNWTYCDVLLQLLNNLLGYPIQHTTFFSPRKATQTYFTTLVNLATPKHHSYCMTTLGCDTSDHPTTLSHTN